MLSYFPDFLIIFGLMFLKFWFSSQKNFAYYLKDNNLCVIVSVININQYRLGGLLCKIKI